MICGIYLPLLLILGHFLRESEGSCPTVYTNIIATESMLTTITKAPMSTLGVYVGSFFPLICTAMVDASLPRILSVASTTYHVFSVVTWSAALGYHVVFHMSCKLKCSIRFMSTQVSHGVIQRTEHGSNELYTLFPYQMILRSNIYEQAGGQPEPNITELQQQSHDTINSLRFQQVIPIPLPSSFLPNSFSTRKGHGKFWMWW